MLTITAALVLQSIAVPFTGIPVVLDDSTLVKSHGVNIVASTDGVIGTSTTVLRNPTASEKKVWVGIPRYALGQAEVDFDVTAEMGVPAKDGTIQEWQKLTVAKAPQLVAKMPLPDVVSRGEIDWGSTLTNKPLMTSLAIPANGTRPLRLRFSTAIGMVDYHANNGKDTGYRGAAYSLATSKPIDLLSASITCGEGLFVPIPQANYEFELGTAGTSIRKQNADPGNLLMKLLLFVKK